MGLEQLDICKTKTKKRRFRLSRNLVEWIVAQLEEELDATNPTINLNNIKLLSQFGIETYNIDLALVHLLSSLTKHQQSPSSYVSDLN